MEATVANIMRKDFVYFKKTDSLTKAIDIFVKNPDAVFPVVDSRGRVIGEVNQHEMLKLAVPASSIREGHVLGPEGIRDVLESTGKTIGDMMKTRGVKVSEDTKITDAARIMLDMDVLTLEVVDKKRNPVGFISELDILRYVKKKLETK